MTRTPRDEAAGLSVADVVHKRFSALPADATISQVRKWFAASSHRRMAFLAEDGRFAGSITRNDLNGDVDPADSAVQLARAGPTVAPEAPAHAGYELAIAIPAHGVPVVARDGTLIRVIGVTDDLAAFCGAD